MKVAVGDRQIGRLWFRHMVQKADGSLVQAKAEHHDDGTVTFPEGRRIVEATIQIGDDDNVIGSLVGRSNCSPVDQFDRETGRLIALRRAAKNGVAELAMVGVKPTPPEMRQELVNIMEDQNVGAIDEEEALRKHDSVIRKWAAAEDPEKKKHRNDLSKRWARLVAHGFQKDVPESLIFFERVRRQRPESKIDKLTGTTYMAMVHEGHIRAVVGRAFQRYFSRK